MTDHLGDDAELYALGLLPDRRTAIEAHLMMCTACRALVSDAELTAATLATTLPVAPAPRARQRDRRFAFAAAAAVVLGMTAAFEAVAVNGAHAQIAEIDGGLRAIAASHFAHVSFTPLVADAPVAKAIYARDGSWLDVLVVGGARPLHLVAGSTGADVEIDVPQPRADGVATIFLRTPQRPEHLELRAGSRAVARATVTPG